MTFEIIGKISNVETFAEGHGIRQLNLLNNLYGKGKWKKRKGVADIKLSSGNIRKAELHWYECHGIGKRRIKIKQFLD